MKNRKILIVEDEYIIALDLKMMFEDLGYNVVAIADSCETALQAINSHKPDLITMDIRIHGEKDGIETTEIIHKEYSIPIVYLTAYTDEKTYQRMKKTDHIAVLHKPPDEAKLFEMIGRLFVE
jgi:two-component system, response regulator PdtaR